MSNTAEGRDGPGRDFSWEEKSGPSRNRDRHPHEPPTMPRASRRLWKQARVHPKGILDQKKGGSDTWVEIW